MKKINILKENQDYNRMIQTIKPYKTTDFIIYIEKNTNDIYHFGFSIGKKICNAVKRNHIRRQIKSIIDKKDYQNGFNCIIMVRKSILQKQFTECEENLLGAFQKLDIIKEKKNEAK